MAMVALNMSGHLQSQLTRSLERILEEAHLSGELKLTGRKLKDFPNSRGKYDLSDTVIADLSKNRFIELPVEVTEFCSLERLELYHNTIRSIPDTVVYLQSLLYLDLSRNQLSVLPSSLCQLPVEVLLVSNNRLSSLPEEMGRMKTLAELDVSCNEITYLPRQIGELPALKSLNLRRNLLTELPIEVTELHLERLVVSNNRISKLPVELRLMVSLVELDLTNNPLTSPPSYLCTRGRVHIFKYLEIQAMKEDKKKGLLNEDIRRAHRKAGHLSDLRFANGIASELRQKRYTTDSGYSTSEDKRWSQEIRGIVADDICRLKGSWPRQESAPIPVKHPDANGTCSGASTPSTISPGDNICLDEELDKAILERRKQDNEDARRTATCKPTNGSPRFSSNSVNKVMSNGPSLSSSTEVIVNGNGLVSSHEEKRPLEHIQTYREYKEALRQQRSQDVYRPRTAGSVTDPSTLSSVPAPSDGLKQPLLASEEEEQRQSQTEVIVPQTRIEVQKANKQILEDSSYNKRPVQKVIPSRNGAAVTFQDPPSNRLVNGNRVDSPGTCYVKPSSPIKTPTSLAHVPGSPGSPRLVTTSVGYVSSVPLSSDGSRAPRSPKIGSSRGVPWNRDVPPEKLSFTMRREFDKAREEAELIEQLRFNVETRLRMVLPEDVAPALADGVVLCHLANHVRPRSVASIHVPSPAVPKLTMARCRRNVDNFLEACRRIGVEEALICCAADVLEGRGTVQVAITVAELLKFHQPRSPSHTAP
ncbi:leucine-rich repeat and calponin homology domain-containing protein isoform X2 [Anabrus simplex]|uniref:leucine-rich repeat and calponin homology domain-containing protein isoform X2 n=1 Tax=Anabrus simplex TaxID=316456 RepID=UPI0035A3623B